MAEQTESYAPKKGEKPPAQTCNDCKFALMQDEGYSNYTVEGTRFYCIVGAHPNDDFDRWYGEDRRLWFGAECQKFEAGEGISMDVELEEVKNLTLEQKALWDAWCSD